MRQKPGIYRIDGPKGRFYVGSAQSVSRRWIEHKRDLRRGTHGNPRLQRAWDKYGEEAFTITVLEWLADDALLLSREQYWIDLLNPVKNGYNVLPTAGSRFGTTHSKCTKEKMSKAHIGRKHGPMAEWQKEHYSKLYAGRKLSEETRRRMSEARTGRVFSEETRAKISAALRGKTLSDDAKRKIAESRRGTKASAETRAKMSAWHKGKKLTPEHRAKLSAAYKARQEKIAHELITG